MKKVSAAVLSLTFLVVCVSVAVAAPPQPGTFDSNGVKLHYLTAGTGEPVLLIHGFTASAYVNWVMPGIFDELAKHYQVIAIDNRGHGASGKPHEVAMYGTQMVDDALRLLDHLKIKRAHIVGYSMGGFITNKLVTTHPDRVISATLGGAGWSRAEDDKTIIEAIAKSLDEGKGIAPLMRALNPPDRPQPTDDQLRIRNQLLMMTNDAKALAACMRGMVNLTVPREKLQENSVPTLCIIGEKDPLKRGVDAMEGVMKNLKVVVVKGGDHISTFRSPVFLSALSSFLAAHTTHSATAAAR